MKQFAVTFLFFLVSLSAWAGGAIVKGQVVDIETGLGEPYATFRIWQDARSDSPIILTITNEDGFFEATLSQVGNYTLEISALGRKTILKTFSVSNLSEMIDFGTLPIENDAETLQSVTVTALRPLVKMEVDKDDLPGRR